VHHTNCLRRAYHIKHRRRAVFTNYHIVSLTSRDVTNLSNANSEQSEKVNHTHNIILNVVIENDCDFHTCHYIYASLYVILVLIDFQPRIQANFIRDSDFKRLPSIKLVHSNIPYKI